MEKRYVAALDQGTTSSRCILFDREQNMVGTAQKEFTQFYPQPGWVEHDPMEIWSSQYGVLMEALAQSGVDIHELAGIGITNQRETAIVWDRDTGKPVYNAIVWQCRRTAGLCEELKADPDFVSYVKDRTGLLIDAYFSATKIRWILDNVPGARERAEAGKLLFGTVDSWLIWKLTGGKVHVTDCTNASRTMLYDIRNLRWDETICERLGIPMSMLPEVRSSSEIYGTVNIQGVEVPIAGIAGDQQAALFGQTCFEPGEAKNTYGTGCFLLMNTGETSRSQMVSSHHKMMEAIKLAFADTRTYVADPRYMKTRVEDMLSESYAAKRRALISDRALTPEAGDPSCGGTIYLCTADSEGNMVSWIQSNYTTFGAGVAIPGTGISLQNRGANFSLDPNSDNCLAGGKKSYHTIIPGFLMKDGEAVGPFGVMGAFMQPQGHVEVLVNTIDYHMNPQEALDAPRVQWIGGKHLQLEREVGPEIAAQLSAMGHEVEVIDDRINMGRGQIIWRTGNGLLVGGTEPRCDGTIAAW